MILQNYIVLPNDWSTSTDSQIQTVRDAGNSDLYKNQIKKVYIENGGSGYETTIDGQTEIWYIRWWELEEKQY